MRNPMTHRRRFTAASLLATTLALASSNALASDAAAIASGIFNALKQTGVLDARPATSPAAQPARALPAHQLANLQQLQQLSAQDWIAYGPSNPTSVVYAFTDATCPVSKKMHRDLAGFAAQGIQVRVISWPRNPGTSADGIHRNVWCAADRQSALNMAMSGRPLASARCSNGQQQSLATQQNLGHRLGVNGTPTLVFEDGYMLAGAPDIPTMRNFTNAARANMQAHRASQR